MGWSACSGDSVVNEPATTDPPMPPPGPATVSADVAFVNVNIVPMDADRVLESQTVLVGREGIVQIGPTDQVAIPDSALRIDGTGQYLLPGLTDMHVHWTANTTSELRNDNFLFLANGVTTIRVMWGSNFALRRRDEIIQGLALGPTVYIASPGMDGPGGPWNTPAVTTTSQAQQTVRQYKADGFRADLLLVQANPLDDLAHLQRRSGVMVRGQWFSEDEIQQRLEAINLSYNP